MEHARRKVLLVLDKHSATADGDQEHLVEVQGDGIAQGKISKTALVRIGQDGCRAIGGISMQPQAIRVGDSLQGMHIINRAEIGRSDGGDKTEGPFSIGNVFLDHRLQLGHIHLASLVDRHLADRLVAKSKQMAALLHREVADLGRVQPEVRVAGRQAKLLHIVGEHLIAVPIAGKEDGGKVGLGTTRGERAIGIPVIPIQLAKLANHLDLDLGGDGTLVPGIHRLVEGRDHLFGGKAFQKAGTMQVRHVVGRGDVDEPGNNLLLHLPQHLGIAFAMLRKHGVVDAGFELVGGQASIGLFPLHATENRLRRGLDHPLVFDLAFRLLGKQDCVLICHRHRRLPRRQPLQKPSAWCQSRPWRRSAHPDSASWRRRDRHAP